MSTSPGARPPIDQQQQTDVAPQPQPVAAEPAGDSGKVPADALVKQALRLCIEHTQRHPAAEDGGPTREATLCSAIARQLRYLLAVLSGVEANQRWTRALTFGMYVTHPLVAADPPLAQALAAAAAVAGQVARHSPPFDDGDHDATPRALRWARVREHLMAGALGLVVRGDDCATPAPPGIPFGDAVTADALELLAKALYPLARELGADRVRDALSQALVDACADALGTQCAMAWLHAQRSLEAQGAAPFALDHEPLQQWLAQARRTHGDIG